MCCVKRFIRQVLKVVTVTFKHIMRYRTVDMGFSMIQPVCIAYLPDIFEIINRKVQHSTPRGDHSIAI